MWENAEFSDITQKKVFSLSFNACANKLHSKSSLDPSCKQFKIRKSEFYGVYQDYREYEDKFFNWY